MRNRHTHTHTYTSSARRMCVWLSDMLVSVANSAFQHNYIHPSYGSDVCDSHIRLIFVWMVYFVCVLFAFLEMLFDFDCGMRYVWCFTMKAKKKTQKIWMKHTRFDSHNFRIEFIYLFFFRLIFMLENSISSFLPLKKLMEDNTKLLIGSALLWYANVYT